MYVYLADCARYDDTFVIKEINQLKADQKRFIILAAELCWLVIDEVEVNLAPV